MTIKVLRLRDFLEGFVDEHALAGEDELLLDVTQEEVEDLGNFFVRGICGWMQSLKRGRLQQQQQSGLNSSVTVADESDGERVEEIGLIN